MRWAALWCQSERLHDFFGRPGYLFDHLLYALEYLLDFLAAVTCPFDSLLYRFGFYAGLLGCVANFMSLPSGNQLTVTAAAAAFLGTSCHTHFLLRRFDAPMIRWPRWLT